ncbi:MAG TPA: hypothetical protein VGN74_06290 [Brevundimonas sp.]|jgi:hypothetical protein|uniref:hypothetical protein n=1 Tax=Brevundimonas sp. TaxID=1871086 RepID=UPI002E11A221|nr:hypothetical protein [Brevundimonas sp.]
MLLISISAAVLALDTPGCAAAVAAAPAWPRCAQAGLGVALSSEQAEADALMAYATAAEPRFLAHFPTTLRPYAVLYAQADAPVAELRAAGFATVLPWASPQTIARAMREALIQNARSEHGAALSAEAEAALEARVAGAVEALTERQGGVISHELAHLWYIDAYWRGSRLQWDGYGSPAPDWVDEAAAILSEPAPMAAELRERFFASWAAASPEDRVAAGGIAHLPGLLSARRSGHRAAPDASAAGGNAEQAGVTVRLAPGNPVSQPSQIRLLADYLMEATGDPYVFARITEGLVGGATFEQWLADQSAYPQLPRNVDELQRRWMDWIEGQPRLSSSPARDLSRGA